MTWEQVPEVTIYPAIGHKKSHYHRYSGDNGSKKVIFCISAFQIVQHLVVD